MKTLGQGIQHKEPQNNTLHFHPFLLLCSATSLSDDTSCETRRPCTLDVLVLRESIVSYCTCWHRTYREAGGTLHSIRVCGHMTEGAQPPAESPCCFPFPLPCRP
jgi:hypothetical protein